MVVSMALGLHPWIANIKDNQYLAAKRAIKTGQTYAILIAGLHWEQGVVPGGAVDKADTFKTSLWTLLLYGLHY